MSRGEKPIQSGDGWFLSKYASVQPCLVCQRGKVRIELAEPFGYGVRSNSEYVDCVKQEWQPVRKVPFEDPNKGD